MRSMPIVLAIAALVPSVAFAYDGSVSMATCDSVTLRVDDIATATGWGAHFSTAPYENGYGGFNVECHLTPDADDNILVLCYDGYGTGSNPLGGYQNQFEVNIGDRDEIDFVTFQVGKRGVQVTAQLLANNGYSGEVVPYTVTSFYPLREATGFCRNSSSVLYYQADGVMAGTPNRTGSGYTLTVMYP